eukprot:gb/GECH01004298.1/.p1 GENE.gb/GECH01004298.1/~~gb/GECH01004298.1/.p1  ORF type:complete len:834 (+),score=173.27 gb/GECH01004298.1/:1-2502(+)
MSLFQLREWWNTKCGVEEEFDKGALCVGNIDNDESGENKIIVGSLEGYLRIYFPRQRGFLPDDLLLETNLEEPILQIELGRFLRDSDSLAIAILHPKSLRIYTVNTHKGNGDKPAFCHLELSYFHDLQRLAYNFTFGPFGQVYGKDYICVQSMDGQLSFFEHETFSFARFLDNFLLPGPIYYSSTMDSFITFNSNLRIECYKFQMLASSSGAEEKLSDQNKHQGRRVQSDWNTNIGEEVYEITIAQYTKFRSTGSAPSLDIIALGERTLYVLKESGVLASQKRLDYFPSCMCSYLKDEERSSHNLIVGSHDSMIMIYSDPKLAWSSRASTVPISIKVSKFSNLKGLITTLDDSGNLQINYLGTDPAANSVEPIESGKDVDYAEIQKEHSILQQKINSVLSDTKKEPFEKINIVAQPSGQSSINTGFKGGKTTVIKFFISFSGKDSLEDITIVIQCPNGIEIPKETINISRLQNGVPHVIPVEFTCPQNSRPTSLDGKITANYVLKESEPHNVTEIFKIPLTTVATVITPNNKTSEYKLNFEVLKEPPNLPNLFHDVIQSSEGEVQSQFTEDMVSIQYTDNEEATLKQSKRTGRIRAQSNSFTGLWLILSELDERLTKHFDKNTDNEDENSRFRLKFSDDIPWGDFYPIIEHHFSCRKRKDELYNSLENKTSQFRSIQKRLLIRYKERNPSPLNNLDVLFEQSYKQICDITENIEENDRDVKAASWSLECAIRIILLLIRRKLSLSDEEYYALENYFTPNIYEGEQGWEEVVDANMLYLLQNQLQNGKDVTSTPPSISRVENVEKLEKHIWQVFQKMQSGARIIKKKKKNKKKR